MAKHPVRVSLVDTNGRVIRELLDSTITVTELRLFLADLAERYIRDAIRVEQLTTAGWASIRTYRNMFKVA